MAFPAKFLVAFFIFLASLSMYTWESEASEFRRICSNESAALKQCEPEYENCINLELTSCHVKFSDCVKNKLHEESSAFCQQRVSDYVKNLELNEAKFRENLIDEAFPTEQSPSQCDLFHSVVQLRNAKGSSNKLINAFPSLVNSIVKCPTALKPTTEKWEKPDLLIPIQMWHGGLSDLKPWKDLDQGLVTRYCGVADIDKVNKLWARRSDCLEQGLPNCDDDFLASLQNVTISSKQRLTCNLYYELVKFYLPIAQGFNEQYKISYVASSDLTTIKSLAHKDGRVYLIKDENDQFPEQCFESKREVSSCRFSYYSNHRDDMISRQDRLTSCYGEVQSTKCRNELIPPIEHIGFFQSFFGVLKEYILEGAGNLCFWVIKKTSKWSFVKYIVIPLIIAALTKTAMQLNTFTEFLNGSSCIIALPVKAMRTVIDIEPQELLDVPMLPPQPEDEMDYGNQEIRTENIEFSEDFGIESDNNGNNERNFSGSAPEQVPLMEKKEKEEMETEEPEKKKKKKLPDAARTFLHSLRDSSDAMRAYLWKKLTIRQ